MASFTDNPQVYQFNPYIDTLATDALVRVEMTKEEQFKQGFEKIQGQFQSIMGLPIAKEETRQYMQSKLSQLKNNIASTTTGDFSDMRLINQIGGLTGRIANDPVVQNGVQSTARAQKAFQQIEEDRKSGKLTPQNEARFMDQYSQWVSDGRADTAFEGSYTSYTDYMKKFIDLYKEVHPNSTLTQNDVRIKDGTGELEVLNERTHEGISASEVQGIWSQVMADPSVQNQLNIDAWYQYRGMDADGFNSHLKQSYEGNLKNIQDKVQEIQKRAAIDKTLDPREASVAIEALRNTGTQLVDQYNHIGQMIQQGDIDTAKTALFTTNLSSTLASNFSWSKDTDKIVDSPLWKAHMDQVKYELDEKQLAETTRYHTLSLQLEAQKMLLSGKKKSGAGNEGDGTIINDIETRTSELPVDEHAGEKGSSSFYDTLKATEAQYGQAANKLIFNIANTIPGYLNPFKLNSDGTYSYNVDPTGKTGYKSMAEAQKEGGNIWQDARKGIINGTANSKVVNMFQEVDPLIRKLQSMRETAKGIEGKYNFGADFQNKTFTVDTKIFGQNQRYEISTKDLLDIYIIENEPVKSAQRKDAIKRISEKYDLSQILDQFKNRPAFKEVREYYKTIENKIKADPNLSNSFAQRESDFQKLQLAFKPLQSTILASEAKDKETIKSSFLGIANSRNINGDANAFIDLLTSEKNKSTPADNSYFLDFDRNTGKYYLKVQRGSDTEQLEVTEKDARNLGFETQNQFWQKFGDDLTLGQNVKTDINGRGISSAYIMNQSPGSKYQVKYHLIGDGQSNYDIALYVQNNPGKGEKIKDFTAQQPIMLGQWFSQNEIMKIVNGGLQDTVIDALLFGK